MKHLLVAASLALALAVSGCNQPTPNLIVTKNHVVIPPDSYYVCPVLKKIPASQLANLTDVDVGRLLTQAVKNNITCKSSLDEIKKFLTEAQTKIN